jgi:hypothetical protein
MLQNQKAQLVLVVSVGLLDHEDDPDNSGKDSRC